MSSYATFQRCRAQLSAKTNVDDFLLATYLEPASNLVNEYCGQNFDELINQWGFSGEVGSQNPTLFLQLLPLFSATTVFNGQNTDGSMAVVSAANYNVLPQSTYTYPKTDIRLKPGNFWQFPYASPSSAPCGPPYSPLLDRAYAIDAVSVLGLWGFHRQYASAWQNTGYTLSAAVATGATQITLTQSPPLFNVDVGDVLKITPSTAGAAAEYLLVTGPIANSVPGTNATAASMNTNTLNVQRAYNNSVAQTFNGGETVFRWKAESTIVTATAMTVAWLYESRLDATGNSFSIPELGTVTVAVDMPPRVKKFLGQPFFNPYYGKP